MLLLQLLGCTMIVVGIWILIDPHSILSRQYSNTAYRQFLDDSSHFGYQTIAAYMLIAVGVVVTVMGFLGCCGALRHSECMLFTVRRLSYVLTVCSLFCSDHRRRLRGDDESSSRRVHDGQKYVRIWGSVPPIVCSTPHNY